MKRYIQLALCLAVALAAFVSCKGTETQQAEKQKVLVLYYSQTSNTQAIAQEFQNLLGADIDSIVPVNPYSGTYGETIERSRKEREEGPLPDIKPLTRNIADYDVIFLGYPVWFGTYALPVVTFVNQTDLSGKKIVPFCTFGSGGLESSIKDLKEKQPNAEVLGGYGVRAARLDKAKAEIENFLKENGYIEGEFVKLEDFSEPQAVTKEESDIFDQAVKDYRMINAKAETVAKRTIPGGAEYLFTAVPLPREDAPKADAKSGHKRPPMPMDPMQIYVTVLDGQTPEFTKVVR